MIMCSAWSGAMQFNAMQLPFIDQFNQSINQLSAAFSLTHFLGAELKARIWIDESTYCVLSCAVVVLWLWLCLPFIDCGVVWCGLVWCGVVWCVVVAVALRVDCRRWYE